ncbi:MAG: ATP-grasp domain-containing protein [Ignavibacteriales bacterium]|nr:ATP-grasp domain-containing protein [Ignavibacteriales bacterium]
MAGKDFTILCIASYEKGFDFMREAKNQGSRVILLTSKSLEHVAWPRECLDEVFFIPDINKEWKMDDVIYGVSFMARSLQIDRIVALDDFDVEKASALREHLRIPGMGDTTARYFRDKLAMRVRAADVGIAVPEFIHILNHQKVSDFAERVPFPYVVKPRLQAGAIGIKKVNNVDELWAVINSLGDQQSFYLLEQYIPGRIHHVDTIVANKEVLFALSHQYGLPPMEVAHQGRVFSSRTMLRGSTEESVLLNLNKKVLQAFGIVMGISHTEFIQGDDGKYYFLETSARVGGANISDLVEAASGVNLWREWAKMEVAGPAGNYKLHAVRHDYAGMIQSLAKQEFPDTGSYNDPEIVWRLNKSFHAGLIAASPSYERIEFLISDYTERFYRDFFISQPLPEKATN